MTKGPSAETMPTSAEGEDDHVVPHSVRPGDVLAGRYRLVDLLAESGGGRFWRARDSVLERHVAVHVISAEDERAAALLEAARRSATVHDQRMLRVLDAEQVGEICYVINEWGSGTSLDILVGAIGAMGPRRAAWLVAEVADSVATAHDAGVAHGRLVPENVLIDRHGEVKVIGMCVDAAMHGLAGDRMATDISDLAGLLYCALTGRWGGVSASNVPSAPTHHGEVLRPRRVRAGIPGQLDALCDEVLHAHHNSRRAIGVGSARGIAEFLAAYVGDSTGMADALRDTVPPLPENPWVVLPSLLDPAIRTDEHRAAGPNLKPGPAPDPEQAPRSEPEDDAPGPAVEELPTEAGSADLRRRHRRRLVAGEAHHARPATPAVREASRASAVRTGTVRRQPGSSVEAGGRAPQPRRLLAFRRRAESASHERRRDHWHWDHGGHRGRGARTQLATTGRRDRRRADAAGRCGGRLQPRTRQDTARRRPQSRPVGLLGHAERRAHRRHRPRRHRPGPAGRHREGEPRGCAVGGRR